MCYVLTYYKKFYILLLNQSEEKIKKLNNLDK